MFSQPSHLNKLPTHHTLFALFVGEKYWQKLWMMKKNGTAFKDTVRCFTWVLEYLNALNISCNYCHQDFWGCALTPQKWLSAVYLLFCCELSDLKMHTRHEWEIGRCVSGCHMERVTVPLSVSSWSSPVHIPEMATDSCRAVYGGLTVARSTRSAFKVTAQVIWLLYWRGCVCAKMMCGK